MNPFINKLSIKIECEGCDKNATRQIGFMVLCEQCAQRDISVLQVWDQAAENENSGVAPDFGLPKYRLNGQPVSTYL